MQPKKKKIWLIPLAIVCAVALIALLAFASSAEREAVVKRTLVRFYNALYIDSDMSAMLDCLAEERHEDFQSVMSLGGITEGFYRNYVQDAILEVGSADFTIDVRINELTEYGVSDLQTIQSTFTRATKSVLVHYEIIFTPAEGEAKVYTNEMILVMVDRHWYMASHLSLPIGANMSIGTAD